MRRNPAISGPFVEGADGDQWRWNEIVYAHCQESNAMGDGMGNSIEAVGAQWIKASPEWVREALERKACLEMFMDKFGIDAPLVSVPKLAKVIGMSRQWVYGQIKAGTFFLPLRMVGGTPLIPVDALIDWYLGCPARAPKPEIQEPNPARKSVVGRMNKAPVVDACGQFDVARMVAKAMGDIQSEKQKRPGFRAA